MKTSHLTIIVPGLFAAAAFVVAASVGAQTPRPAPSPATTSSQAAPMTSNHKSRAAAARHDADMKTECQAMMARIQETSEKIQAMDATLDKLVAEMNAAKSSKDVDALEKPMAAVLNELVAQRKTLRSTMMEMQPMMMAHMVHHVHMHGTKGTGTMECPMMKTGTAPGTAPELKVEEKKPSM